MKCFDNGARPPPPAAEIPRAAWAVVAAGAPFHLALAVATDLSPDEAYYLSAARLRVDPVDHPPLLMWLLRAADRLPGPVELRVRLWAVAFSLATSAAVVLLAQRRGAPREGVVLAAWLSTWALLPTAGGFVATPDGPLLLAVTVALLWVTERPAAGAGSLLLGGLAKVTALPAAALLAAGSKRWWVAVAPWAALPWLWPSLGFQLRHAFGGGGRWSPLEGLGALIAAAAAQAGLWSPPVVWRGLRGLGALPRADRALALGLTALVAGSALVRGLPPEPNWWAPAALVVIVSFARGAGDLSSRARRAILLCVLVPTAIAAAHTARPLLPLPEHLDPTARLHGWQAGREPLTAPGIGPYGAAAERCAYLGRCEELSSYFNEMRVHESSRR